MEGLAQRRQRLLGQAVLGARAAGARRARSSAIAARRSSASAQRSRRRSCMEAPAAIAVMRGPVAPLRAGQRPLRPAGRASSDLVGKPGRDALPELIEQGVWDLFDRVYAHGRAVYRASYPALLDARRRRRAREAFFNWVAQPTRAVDGSIDGVLIFAVEVTDQVLARRGAGEGARRRADCAARPKPPTAPRTSSSPCSATSCATRWRRSRRRCSSCGCAGERARRAERPIIERQRAASRAAGRRSARRLAHHARQDRAQARADRALRAGGQGHRDGEPAARAAPAPSRACTVPPRACSSTAIAARLAQVFANLITNAAKYTEPDGHISIEARASRGRHRDRACATTASGISAEMLPRVFELFSQERQSLDSLAGRARAWAWRSCAAWCTMHGGRVSAHSDGDGQRQRVHGAPAGDRRTAPRSRRATLARPSSARRARAETASAS